MSDYFDEHQRTRVEFIRAALAEVGWPSAEVIPNGVFSVTIHTDEPQCPPYAVAAKAIELANLSVDAGLYRRADA